jgi:hypothetical protein
MTTWHARLINSARREQARMSIDSLPGEHFPPQRIRHVPPTAPTLEAYDPNATIEPTVALDVYRLVSADEVARVATYRIVS